MKKIYLVMLPIFLLAAGCNTSSQTSSGLTPTPTISQFDDNTNSPTGIPKNTNTTPVNSMVYTNTEFGFTMTLNNDWKGYKVVREVSMDQKDKYVSFGFFQPTTDPLYVKEKNGYRILELSVYKVADYNAEVKAEHADKQFDGIYLDQFFVVARSSQYVIVEGAGGNAPPPDDIRIDNNASTKVAKSIKFFK